jgi:DNA-binding MarR family transcriptional regulator
MISKSKDTSERALRQGLIDAIGTATQAFQRSTDAFDDAVAQRMGLNRTDLRCLDWLFDGPKAAGQLATGIGLTSAATTTLLDRLEQRGLVRRIRDISDRRKVFVEMTESGRKQTSAYYAPLAKEGARLLEQYTPAQLQAMRDHLLAAATLIDTHRARLAGDAAQSADRN